jgi:transcriptional regulator with XRE-family HTH domain
MPSKSRDEYIEIIYGLRSIRKPKRLSQKDMAVLLKTSQSKVSRLESVCFNISLDFLISYARVLGYDIAVCKTEYKTLAAKSDKGIDVSAQERARQIISELLEEKKSREKAILLDHSVQVPDPIKGKVITKHMAEAFRVTERVIRRLETDNTYMPDAYLVFQYASHLRMALILSGPPVSMTDKYDEFLFVLRGIRESYGITQNEMGVLMNVEQETISKFESARQDVKLDFLVFYASLLGYDIRVVNTFMSKGELARFRKRQSWITKALRNTNQGQIKEIFNSGMHWSAIWPGDIVGESTDRIISNLRKSKRIEGLTTKRLSEKLGVSERTIRRFERAKNYIPSASLAFKYASLLNMELRLEKRLRCKRETLGSFYIRRCIALYHWLRDPPGRESVNEP